MIKFDNAEYQAIVITDEHDRVVAFLIQTEWVQW